MLSWNTGFSDNKDAVSMYFFEMSIPGQNVCFVLFCVVNYSSSTTGYQILNKLAHKRSVLQPWNQPNKRDWKLIDAICH